MLWDATGVKTARTVSVDAVDFWKTVGLRCRDLDRLCGCYWGRGLSDYSRDRVLLRSCDPRGCDVRIVRRRISDLFWLSEVNWPHASVTRPDLRNGHPGAAGRSAFARRQRQCGKKPAGDHGDGEPDICAGAWKRAGAWAQVGHLASDPVRVRPTTCEPRNGSTHPTGASARDQPRIA